MIDLGDHLPDDRPVLEPVPAEPGRDPEPVHGRGSDDRETVGRHLVQPGPPRIGSRRRRAAGRRPPPAARALRSRTGRRPWCRRSSRRRPPIPMRTPSALAVEIEGARRVDHERPALRDTRERTRRHDDPRDRLDRELHAGGGRERPRPRARGEDDGARGHRAARGPDPRHGPGRIDLDRRHGRLQREGRAGPSGERRVPLGQGGRGPRSHLPGRTSRRSVCWCRCRARASRRPQAPGPPPPPRASVGAPRRTGSLATPPRRGRGRGTRPATRPRGCRALP